MKESFDSGHPEDEDQHNNWPTEELLPGFRNFTEGFYQVTKPPLGNTTDLVRGLDKPIKK